MLLKWPIKCERKCAGTGFSLQKYFCEVGRMDVLGPLNKGALPSAKNTSFCLIFLSSFSLWPLVIDRGKVKILLVPYALIV